MFRKSAMPILRYLGHSACEIVEGDVRILIDPFLTGNPAATESAEDFHPTAIILTHAHNDHFGDTLEISRRTGAPVVAMHEISDWLIERGVNSHGMSTGGGHTFEWGWVKLTAAWHSSTYITTDGRLLPMGTPAGVLLRLGDRVLYHAGDTGLFGDMSLIGRIGIDLAMLPIGDNYTMGPDDALEAVRLLQPRLVAPIHYNTFPVIAQDGEAWARRVTETLGLPAVAPRPGGEIRY